jgi:copper transport protein
VWAAGERGADEIADGRFRVGAGGLVPRLLARDLRRRPPGAGAFTFAVGPNAGPAPQFTIPHISQTATTTPLLLARWAVFLTVMSAIGLFIPRMLIARPLVRRVEETNLSALSLAFVVSSLLGLVAIPVYLEESTAVDSLHSFFAVGALVPLWRTTAFGRGYLNMELCFALFCVAAWIALWVDRPQQPRRTIASLFALAGALAAAAAVLVFPGASGHAGQTAPRGLSVLLDWLHLVSGSLWLGGLIGLLVLWRSLPVARRVAGLIVCVPRFSNVAFVSVLVLLGTGIGATVLHLPVLAALWQTSYGKVILIKLGILLTTIPLAAINLLRNKPGLLAAGDKPALGEPPARLLRRLVGGEATLIAGAVFAAALLSSLAPPPPAFAEQESALVRVGPGRVAATVERAGYTLQILVNPNRAAAPNSFALKLSRNGQPVRDADITLAFAMLDMQMPQQEYRLDETSPGIYTRKAPALVMVGHWGLSFTITPKGAPPFTATSSTTPADEQTRPRLAATAPVRCRARRTRRRSRRRHHRHPRTPPRPWLTSCANAVRLSSVAPVVAGYHARDRRTRIQHEGATLA